MELLQIGSLVVPALGPAVLILGVYVASIADLSVMKAGAFMYGDVERREKDLADFRYGKRNDIRISNIRDDVIARYIARCSGDGTLRKFHLLTSFGRDFPGSMKEMRWKEQKY